MHKMARWIPCLVACALLAGVVLDRKLLHAASRNADDYHARISAAADQLPVHIGDWVSQETPVLPAAVAMLRPNVVMERRYKNLANGLEATLLLVQCRDARDLLGHYPPVCYPAHGCQLISRRADTRVVNSMTIHGTMYEFSSDKLAVKSSMNVYDFMILPNGKIAPDMDGVYSIARDRQERYFGAAQIQIVTDALMSDEDRRQTIDTLLGSFQPVIDQIRSGAVQ